MILRNFFKKYLYELIIIIFIFTIDRVSKLYVISFYEKTGISEIYFSKYLNIHFIWNEGIAFGLFSFGSSFFYNVLSSIILLIIIFLFFYAFKSNGIKKYSLLMIFAGALGNLFDRLYYKSVPDFIDFHFQNFHWFIFNVADIFITLGVIFMIFLEFTGNNKKENE